MPYDSDKHHRRSIRLRGHDYTRAGAYFVTICAQGRECLFGEIKGCAFQPNRYGQIVAECLAALSDHFTPVALDISVVMPNHIHTIVMLDDTPDVPPVRLGQVVAYLKYRSTTHINDLRGTLGLRVWQRNYYEHMSISSAMRHR
jgi:putative transposase